MGLTFTLVNTSGTERWESGGSFGRQSKFGHIVRESVQEYIVESSELTDNEETVLTDPACPALGSVVFGNFYCVDRHCVRNPLSTRVFYLTATYSNQPPISMDLTGGGGSPTSNDNPLARPMDFTFTFERKDKPLEQDFHPTPRQVQNSAGEQFDPPITVGDARLKMTIVKNKASYDPYFYGSKRFKLNDAQFVGYFDEETVLFVDHQAASRFENGTAYWQVSCTFLIDDFDLYIKDKGFHQLFHDGVNPDKLDVIRDKWGLPLTKPVNLDGNGKALAPNATPVYLLFFPYNTTSFTGLP